jgi:site-specific DNA-methyltransferase (adenine-specific)
MWLYGSGFPKSLDVSKAIDRAAGAEREVVGTKPQAPKFNVQQSGGTNTGYNKRLEEGAIAEFNITAPATPEAQQWEGWGTALKPAHEPIVVARKPLIGTVANNVLTYGTGALNIDGSRVGYVSENDRAEAHNNALGMERLAKDYGEELGTSFEGGWKKHKPTLPTGRWPANVIHDGLEEEWSRFFYCAKASKLERNAGLDGLPEREGAAKGNGLAQTCAICGAGTLDGCDCPDRKFENPKRQNFHPTVKPLALMRYLIKLVTPPGGIVLDPFLGSGTTAVAATLEGFDWIGCEMTEDYWPIIEARVEWAKAEAKKSPITLF